MRMILWKEWRETRWLAAGVLAICCLISIYWKQMFPGEAHAIQPVLWIFLALALGARSFASEQRARTIEWLAAQPIRLNRVWAVKAASGFCVLIAVVVISGTLDYVLMAADPFYEAVHLLVVPFTWMFIMLLAIYAVALFSSTLVDKTVMAFALTVVLLILVAFGATLIGIVEAKVDDARFLPDNIPLTFGWIAVAFLAGSWLRFAWHDIRSASPRTPWIVGIGIALGTVLVVLRLTSAGISLDDVARITHLGFHGRGRTTLFFRLVADEKAERLSREYDEARALGDAVAASKARRNLRRARRSFASWTIDLDGSNLERDRIGGGVPIAPRSHPAWAKKHVVRQWYNHVITKIESGPLVGGYRIEELMPGRFLFNRPVQRRKNIWSPDGTVSFVGINGPGWERNGYPGLFMFVFVEERADGEKRLRIYSRGFSRNLEADIAELGSLEAVSPDVSWCILSRTPDQGSSSVFLIVKLWYEISASRIDKAYLDQEVRGTVSFVTNRIVQYRLGGKMYLADIYDLDGPGLEVPDSVVKRGTDAVRRVVAAFESGLLQPARSVADTMRLLDSVAAGWDVDLAEEILDTAVFVVPGGRQIVYIKKENDEESSLWLLDVASSESSKVLDDIDVTSPAEPNVLVACVTDDYFAFVRDAKTIWTYRDGILSRIVPPPD